MRQLPPVDLHAHIDPARIRQEDLEDLQALIFAATRSLDETDQALRRTDPGTVWGAGCHPGLPAAQRAFDRGRFAELIARTAYVSEIGLDGASPVPLHVQRLTFEAILEPLQATPRITSIHSYSATVEVLYCLVARPVPGPVLHWWLGDPEQTRRAVELGCYFSVNPAMARHPEIFRHIPLERILTETDHPFGDRAARRGRKPGNVTAAEHAISREYDIGMAAARDTVWRNLADLTIITKCGPLLPRGIQITLATIQLPQDASFPRSCPPPTDAARPVVPNCSPVGCSPLIGTQVRA